MTEQDRLLRRVNRGRRLPVRSVTRAGFVKAAKAAGWSADKIALQSRICAIMGSHVQVGDELLSIKGKR